MSKPTWRRFIKDIDPYIPGKSIEDVRKEYHLERVIRLASNENPLGASPKAIEAAKQSLDEVGYYPDTTAKALREQLAHFYNVSSEEIMTANGADNILTLLISAYVNKGDEVVYCTPTFPAYRSTTLLMGGVPVEVDLTADWCFDLDAIAEHITDKTKIIFICNPNNPTGTIVSSEQLVAFLDKVPNQVQVVLDEAYIEYVDDLDYMTGIKLYKKSYPVITVRTFSKYYGLAGLRTGYAVGSKEKLAPMLRIREPFATNRVAIHAATAALSDKEFAENHLQETKSGKEYLTEKLKELGFEVIHSHTNFLFVHLKKDSITLFERLLSYGIIIRPCAPWGYTEYARITVGTKEQNQFLLQILDTIQAETSTC
ncbi:MAG TPA: histidinol-phosphate transaminase [Virgibacillus sp.]|nr:histidinol-phosphate transaminase [Virgibacillus sp.]HLR68871.1 histidinol-phosphate transaminase [Virgibacillus sp.]